MKDKSRIVVLAVVGLLALPILASAAHWPNFGGDPGHSGNQPVLAAELPTEFEWTASDPGTVRNSIVTTAGPAPDDQLLAYGKTVVVSGTSNDRAEVNLRQLDTGTERIPAGSQDVDDGADDPDAFGAVAGGVGVSFVDTSTAEGPGQLFVVHNDTDSAAGAPAADCSPLADPNVSSNDLAIAHFNEATGAKVRDVAIGPAAGDDPLMMCEGDPAVSDGYTVESSPVITPPVDAAGTRWIFFIAKRDAGGDARLFGVQVDNAGSPGAVIHSDAPQFRDIPGANTKASPTVLFLNNPDLLAGSTTMYVAVPVDSLAGPDIRTFAVGDIDDSSEDGPIATGAGGTPQTISVPVTENGRIPGQEGSGATKAPALYVAYQNGEATTVRKYFQQGSSASLTESPATSPTAVAGPPAPALALSVLADAEGEVDGRVILTTRDNLYLLNSETLTPVERLAEPEEPLGAGDGFSRNTALVSGELIFVTNDDGTQAVLSLEDAEPVPTGDFDDAVENQGADFALGQPSLSNGFAQFLTDRGVFVYRTGVEEFLPVAHFTMNPNPARVGDTVTFDASGSTDPDGSIARYEWDLDGNGDFETDRGTQASFSTTASAAGTFRVQLRVTDDRGNTALAAQDLVINQPGTGSTNLAPVASFTATPNPARPNQQVSYDARASRDPDGSIVRYEWDLDGNGSFETNTGNRPTATRTYTQEARVNVRLKVTDNGGAAAETSRQVTVAIPARVAPRSLSSRVNPLRDRVLPYRFTTRGQLLLPSGVSRTDGCRGRVTVTVKVRKRTVSRRTARLTRQCSYSSRVSFRNRDRLRGARRLRFIARFQGNAALLPRKARTRRARIG